MILVLGTGQMGPGIAVVADDHAAETAGYERLRRETLRAERQLVVSLRDRGVINDEVVHRIQRELDLEKCAYRVRRVTRSEA